MKDAFSRLKDRIMGQINEDSDNLPEEQYLEINPSEVIDSKAKIMVRPFIIKEFQDIKPALDGLREGHTIALVNIKPLKDKDIVELKRAVNKLKKTCDAIEGDIAGFGEDWLVATPSFAKVHRQTSVSTQRTSGIIEDDDKDF
ncbi:cell division protein SepF [Candidatus Woesearchaeota archaeon]|nr:cell division protein SepF [Candidatus Woesearchaeota archaeon]